MSTSQTFTYGTPAAAHLHRILTIPELLDLIFSFLDQQSNATNACVCKAWSHIALSALWKDVHELWRLVSLLVPLKKRRDSIYVRPINQFGIIVFIMSTGIGTIAPIDRLAPLLSLCAICPLSALQYTLSNT